MEFTLYYRGELKANGNAKHKQQLRRFFHAQLKKLWNQTPLKKMQDLLKEQPEKDKISVIQSAHGFNFAPLVTEKLHLIAELKILLLRPGPPGVITQSGDIDNRLKTLFDALRIPKESTAIPENDKPGAKEDPFFCLLEDDALITKVTVETDRLLDKPQSSSEVVLLIRVKTKATQLIWGNIGLG